MATHKSAEKRARQTVRRSARNSQAIGAVRTVEKKLRAALNSAEGQKAQQLLVEFSSSIMKAAKTGRIHKANASRKISRLSTSVHKLVTGQLTSNQARQASKRG